MLLDGLIVLVLILSFSAGYKKGVIYMLFFFIGLFLGTIAALNFSAITAQYISQWLTISEAWLPIVSLIVTFLVVFAAVRFIAQALVGVLKFIQLNFLNKVVGGAIGAALAFTVLSLALWYINGFNILSEQLTTSSSLLPVIDSYTPSILTIVEQVLPFLKNMMANFEALFQQYNPTKEGESVSFS